MVTRREVKNFVLRGYQFMRRLVRVSHWITSWIVLLAGGAAFAYNEAPMLAEKVKAGLLPPVEERLPENPLVVEPLESIGKYGGTWVKWTTNREWARQDDDDTGLIRGVDDAPGIEPNWIESWSPTKTAMELYESARSPLVRRASFNHQGHYVLVGGHGTQPRDV